MAQQVFYPFDPLQPGPMYFLTPRKCAIFGVCNEAIPRQINYLIDEAVDCGKGANSIVSMLHHFYKVRGLGERNVHLHADNCGGQNKNNIMAGYLLWRCLVGLHENITLSFMITGHTKFSPDWCFGLLKKQYRRTKVGSLADLARTGNSSATVNVAQAVGSMDGTVHVPVYDWASYLGERLQKLPGIKSLHHLRFSKDHPGHVFVKERSDSPEIDHDLLKDVWNPAATDLPQRVTPSGLTPTRQMYLYQKIREYCPDECKDVTCPEPNITSSESASSTTRSAPRTTPIRSEHYLLRSEHHLLRSHELHLF